MNDKQFSHIDDSGKPVMVDVSDKAVTRRTATARATVVFPPDVFNALQGSGHRSKKGPVIDTAIVAGVMAAKNTAGLIPFCHPLPLDGCDLDIVEDAANFSLVITAKAKVTHKTGVEMEALTAATVAALTVYDMCKALSHDIVIRNVCLIEKTGGKSGVSSQG
ncbi:MAG: cyclic pyranopterin monophosphate synthase MoaC [bacterium]